MLQGIASVMHGPALAFIDSLASEESAALCLCSDLFSQRAAKQVQQ
jgi:hypothetical protein